MSASVMRSRFIKTVICSNFLLKHGLRQCATFQDVLQDNDTYIVENPNIPQKLLKVAIIGMPNAGKSTFINQLMDRKVCPTSSKIHTTRKKTRAIFTEGDSQIVFLDTPGVVTNKEQKRHNLENSFLSDSDASLNAADTIGVIHDVGDLWCRERLDLKLIRLLEKYQRKPSFLVLNKVDVLKSKKKLLEITRLITMNCLDGKPTSNQNHVEIHKDHYGWPHFKEIFMVSSLTGNGLSRVKEYLAQSAKPHKWIFPADKFSDETPENIIVNTVKATLLDFLPQEIPYQLEPLMELYEVDEGGMISTVVMVKCTSERIARLVAGTSNGRLKQITESAQKDLEDVFQQFVKIRIVLKPPDELKK